MNYHIVTYGWELGIRLWIYDVIVFITYFLLSIAIFLIMTCIINIIKKRRNKK